jgi:hypothetical protein
MSSFSRLVEPVPDGEFFVVSEEYFVLKKILEKIDLKYLLCLGLSFKTKASTSPDKNPHIPR